ncbi:MAG: hypothetical protein JKY63_04370 [Rhodobiaceae bacterium]|nr:hypothetical protein [Rhodobiaceae bacterium]
MQFLIIGGFLVAAVINLLPVIGIMGVPQLEKAYGVQLSGADLAILLRHRAVLFGIVGGLLATAAFMPSLRVVAFSAGMLSMVSFLIFQALEGGGNAALVRVAYVDYVGIAALAIAGVAAFVQSS